MKKLTEKWIEFEEKIAGNVRDKAFYPTINKDIKKMISKLNKITMKRKKKR
jgi:hypothetical protein